MNAVQDCLRVTQSNVDTLNMAIKPCKMDCEHVKYSQLTKSTQQLHSDPSHVPRHPINASAYLKGTTTLDTPNLQKRGTETDTSNIPSRRQLGGIVPRTATSTMTNTNVTKAHYCPTLHSAPLRGPQHPSSSTTQAMPRHKSQMTFQIPELQGMRPDTSAHLHEHQEGLRAPPAHVVSNEQSSRTVHDMALHNDSRPFRDTKSHLPLHSSVATTLTNPYPRGPTTLQAPEFGGKDNIKPLDFISATERYFATLALPQHQWLLQIDYHLKGTARQWWNYKRSQVRSWTEFTSSFLSYYDSLISREELQRDLEVRQKPNENLERFVWRKHELYRQLHPTSTDKQMTQYVIGLLHSDLKVLLRSMEICDLEQLVQKGRVLQQDLKEADNEQRGTVTNQGATDKVSGNRAQGNATNSKPTNDQKPKNGQAPVKCSICNKNGHTQFQCYKRESAPSQQAAAAAAITSEEGLTLDNLNSMGKAPSSGREPSC